MTNYARTEEKYSKLSTEFGETLARKWFGDEVVDEIPKYVRGEKKGKLKGYLKWIKVTKGGWVRTGGATHFSDYEGYVQKPNEILNKWIELPQWGENPQLIAGDPPHNFY